jgi:hypothetical protein
MQLKTSTAVGFFAEKFKNKYGLDEYSDPYSPVIFYGMFFPQDYAALNNHKGSKTIIWAGTDAMQVKGKIPADARNIAKSHFVQKSLQRQGIKSELIPITPTEIKMNVQPKGDNIYFYYGNNRKKYGGDLVDIIKAKTNYNIIEANHTTYAPEQLKEVYKSCFLGLRLTEHDGLSNTVVELGLMGRMCIHNNTLPNCLNYSDISDVLRLIDSEYHKRHESGLNVAQMMFDELNIDSLWLH